MKKVFQDSNLPLDQFQGRIEETAKLLGVNLFLLNDQGKDPLTGYDQGLSQPLIRSLKTGRAETYSLRFSNKISLFVTRISVPGQPPVFLAMVYDWDRFFSFGYRMLLIMGIVALAMVGIGFYISRLISFDLSDPLTQMMEQTERISKGDLNVDFNIISNDELGILAGRLKGMILNLRELVERVSDSYEQVRKVISEILKSSESVAKGAEEQTLAIDNTSHNISEVSRAVKEVSDNVEILHQSGTETTDRAEKMIQRVEQVEHKEYPAENPEDHHQDRGPHREPDQLFLGQQGLLPQLVGFGTIPGDRIIAAGLLEPVVEKKPL